MKDKYNVTHMWNIKKVNKPNKNKHTDPKSRVGVTRGEGQGMGEVGKRADTVVDGNEIFGDKL